jgi:hypothetical protein
LLVLAIGYIGAIKVGLTNIVTGIPSDVLVFVAIFLMMLVGYFLIRDVRD